ncbi:MAG: signal peptidase I [Lachnospiraceae bacterium]|nr:signal peptidase I [Lachnospiraceae bacterium]
MANKDHFSEMEEESTALDSEAEYWEIGEAESDAAENEDAAEADTGKTGKGSADAGEEKLQKPSFVRSALREIVSFGASLALAWVVAMFVVTYVGTLCTVDGVSMENTLQDGDRLWADKLTYRFSDPQRFDIIIFPPKYDQNSKFIKRIIGLPGETVYIDEEGNIYIDGEILEEDYGKETIRADLRNLASQEITLGEDEYFVLGDNRNESLDSRYEVVGLVKRSDIFGKAVFRLWPLSGFGFLD